MATPVILVPGTHEEQDAWWKKGSPFYQALIREGIQVLDPDDPFVWSFDLDGDFWDWVFHRPHRDWIAGGEALKWYAHVKYPPQTPEVWERVNLISHSHGGQVAAFALSRGLRVRTWVSLAMPIRRDLTETYRRAFPYVRKWVGIAAGEAVGLPWQALGSLLNTRFIPLQHPQVYEPAESHSGLMRPELWSQRGWWEYLKW